jgi:hypothetical protein
MILAFKLYLCIVLHIAVFALEKKSHRLPLSDSSGVSIQTNIKTIGSSHYFTQGFKDGIASGLAAAISKLLLQPFDTIKTVQQASKVRLNPLSAAQIVIRNRGALSLWSGVGVTVLGSSPSVAIYFGVYSSTKKYISTLLPSNLKILSIALSAAVGNSVASVFRVPCEVKCTECNFIVIIIEFYKRIRL